MNLSSVDWSIITIIFLVITAMALFTRRYTKSVADFLAANRSAGRYLMTMSQGMVTLATVSAVANFEVIYKCGFSENWWKLGQLPLALFLAMLGYIIYRYRETRVLTLGQFFEIRYSKKFRVFMGVLGWVSGIVNFGIFPAVGSRFFIYFCNLPQSFFIGGFEFTTFVVVLFALLSISLAFAFIGGQIAVIVTDFTQAAISNLSLILIVGFLLWKFDWSVITEAVLKAEPGKSMVNPFDTEKIEGFSIWYFLIGYVVMFFNTGAIGWQSSQGYNASAKSAHEFKMSQVLGFFRAVIYHTLVLALGISAYVVMNQESFSDLSDQIGSVLDTITNETIRTQMTVPVALGRIFPIGLKGLVCAVMLAAFISTHDTYIHSWGSVFIQDVILPFRKKNFTPKQHMRILRMSMCLVTVYVFFFALFFKQNDYIFFYMAITGSIFLSGVGPAIICGLYWKKGTCKAAWISAIYGAVLSIGTIVIRQVWPVFNDGQICPFNTFYIAFGISVTSFLVYIIVSLLQNQDDFNLERMLHRGKYSISRGETQDEPLRGLAVLGIKKGMSMHDRLTFLFVGVWIFGWFAVFIVMSIYHFTIGISDEAWASFWQIFIYFCYGLVLIVTFWFLFGGIKNLKEMFDTLRVLKRDDKDNGTVIDHHSANENYSE